MVPSSKPVAAGGGASGGGNEKDKMGILPHDCISNYRHSLMCLF